MISGIFSFLAIMAIVMLLIGLIKPDVLKDKKTGEIPSRKNIAAGSIALLIVSIIVAGIFSTPSPPKDFEFTEAGIKSLNSDITSINLIKQVMSADNQDGYAVEIDIARNPSTADSEWNYLAQMYVDSIGKRLFEKPQVSKIRMVFRSPSNENKQWSQVKITKRSFPENWHDLTYHQFFSYTDPDPSTFQTASWLCHYYSNYDSARPKGEMPKWCEDYADGRFD